MIKMNTEELSKQIKELSLSEKLLLVTDIWDGIAKNNDELPLPEWQKIEVEKRYEEYLSGKLNLHNWDKVHEDLRNKYK